MGKTAKRFLKISLALLIGGLVIAASFVSGMVVYANFFVPANGNSSVTTALPFFPSAPNTSRSLQFEHGEMPSEFATFWEAWAFLNEQFYGEIPPDDERVYGAIRGMVTAFGDQHTAFIDPVQAAISGENMQGSFSGVGATVRMDEAGRLTVVDPTPNHPAFLAGVRPDDIVLEVDGQSLEGLNLLEAVMLIRGPTGSTVVLTILREGELEPLEISIVRAKIELEVVESELLDTLDGADKLAHIRLTQFSGGAAEKVSEAIESLREQGASGIIFDLRSNPGGLLSESVNVSSLFMEKGQVVVREKLRSKEEKAFEVIPGLQVATEMPLVVLVNRGSASASEIVAGAVQDAKRATIIGQRTFGKGSVQLPHNLSDGSELRVTIAEWLTPNNRQIHGEGITPDVEVDLTFEDFEQERDPQLDKAIELLSEKLGK